MNQLYELLYKNVNFCQNCGKNMRLKEDNEGKIRAICAACGFTLYKNPIPAVAILLLNEQAELLLVKRGIEPQKGMWALPSGYAEIYLTPEENAMAELKEETGLEGEIIRSLGWFYGFSPIYYRVLSLGFRIRQTGGNLKAGDDAVDARFFALENLPEIAFAAHRHFINLETGLDLIVNKYAP